MIFIFIITSIVWELQCCICTARREARLIIGRRTFLRVWVEGWTVTFDVFKDYKLLSQKQVQISQMQFRFYGYVRAGFHLTTVLFVVFKKSFKCHCISVLRVLKCLPSQQYLFLS